MKEKIYDARTGMEYVLVGDYYLPALKLPRTRPIGRWGMLHKAYLKLRKPAYYQSLLLSGKLDTVFSCFSLVACLHRHSAGWRSRPNSFLPFGKNASLGVLQMPQYNSPSSAT